MLAVHRAEVTIIGHLSDRDWNSVKACVDKAFAKQAGSAVYIPHPRTWHLEHEQVPDPYHRLHILDRFTALQDLF